MKKILSESGKRKTGIYVPVATNKDEAMNVLIEPGVVYENRITTQYIPDWLLDPIVRAILGIQETFQGIQVTYYKIERNEIVYQFWIPPGTQVRLAWYVWAVIAIVLAIIGFLVIGWVVYQVKELGPALYLILIALALGAGGYFLAQLRGYKKGVT